MELLLLAAALLLGTAFCIPPVHLVMKLAVYLQEER